MIAIIAGMPISPFPGETPIPVALTLESPCNQYLWTTEGGVRRLHLNFVHRITYATNSMNNPRHQMYSDRTIETMELPPANAYRLARAIKKIRDPHDHCYDDKQAAFQYVGDLERPLSAPVHREQPRRAIDIENPRIPLPSNSIYSITKGWNSPVFRAFMTFSNPERCLLVENRTWCVANTRDLAKLGGIVTATAFL